MEPNHTTEEDHCFEAVQQHIEVCHEIAWQRNEKKDNRKN